MRLIKRLVELAFFVFLLSVFSKNMDVQLQIKYYGLTNPITVAFWELVIFCVAFGIIVAAFGDFITQLKWIGERRRMMKTDREHQGELAGLNDKIRGLETENQNLQRQLDKKSEELSDLQSKLAIALASADKEDDPSAKGSEDPMGS
jgi:hypothetical protein